MSPPFSGSKEANQKQTGAGSNLTLDDPQDVGNTLLRNVGLSAEYMALQP
jgi:hypothetical protein